MLSRLRLAVTVAVAAALSACATPRLHKAVEAKNLPEVERLLAAGDAVDAREPHEDLTALGWAAANGDVEIATALLAHGANANARNHTGFTPLHAAAYYDQAEMVELLLSKGADPAARTSEGETPLHRAVARLGPYRRSPRQLGTASELERMMRTVSLLLARGADANATASSGTTPLLFAAATGHPPLLRLLVARGAGLEARGPDGVTPLYVAVVSGQPEAVATLLELGAKVEVATKSGYTPLSYAARSGAPGIAKLLIDKGADVNAKDELGRTPLLFALWAQSLASPAGQRLVEQGGARAAPLAAERRRLGNAEGSWHDVALLLVKSGADVRAHPPEAESALLLAAVAGDVEVVRALLDHGAPVDEVTTGETALHGAIAERHLPVAKLLLERGANVKVVNVSRRTPLHFVGAFLDDAAMVEVMVARGAEVNAVDVEGHTPLAHARRAGHPKTAEALLARGGR